MGLSVDRPDFHAESFAIGFKSRIQIFFKLWSQESGKRHFLGLKSIFRLYKPYLYGSMTHQNVDLDQIFHNLEFERILTQNKIIL